MPLEDARLQGMICEELGLDTAELPYAAELIAVAAGSSHWEPAAERLIRPFALSLLVPSQHYRVVADYVDRHHLGRRLVYFQLPAVAAQPQLPRPGTMASHLSLRPGTPASAWLQDELTRRFNHVCVTDSNGFATEQRAVTLAGQVKEGSRHVKDDRSCTEDRRFYVLGWDTTARRARLRQLLPETQQLVDRLDAEADQAGQRKGDLREREYAARQMTDRFTDPAAVDVTAAVDALGRAEALYETLASSPELKQLIERLDTCEQDLDSASKALSAQDRKLGAANEQLERHRKARERAERALAATASVELTPDAASALDEALRAAAPEPVDVDECEAWGRKLSAALAARTASAASTRERVGRMLIGR